MFLSYYKLPFNFCQDKGVTKNFRAIIRFSVDGEKNGAPRNKLTSILGGGGFQRTKTGTWEIYDADIATIIGRVSTFLSTVSDPSKIGGISPQAIIDHLWIYIDQVDDDELTT